jgi:hypothetical protein
MAFATQSQSSKDTLNSDESLGGFWQIDAPQGFEPMFFEIESPFLVQFWCSWDGNYGFIGRLGRKPPNFVE